MASFGSNRTTSLHRFVEIKFQVMSGCLGINCTGAPRRRSINGLQDNWCTLRAEMVETRRKIDEKGSDYTPPEPAREWIRLVAALEGKIEKLTRDYRRLPPTDSESANTSLVDESQETRAPENAIQKSKCSPPFTDHIKGCLLQRKFQLTDNKVLHLLKQVPVITVPAQSVPTEPTTGMEPMIDEVWRHVENQQAQVRLLGLHGIGGVGKTTLLKAIDNKLCSSTLNFDLQLWIVVSKTPNFADIQNLIGEKIGLRDVAWKTKSQEEKAKDIYNVLQRKKYILLLDDLWERFDLTKIGIPVPGSQNRSKIIFTTRSLQVCEQMEATPIEIQCLNDEEAWNLFKKSVGENLVGSYRDIEGPARVVMNECKGLPLALVVVGRAMTLKGTVNDWNDAINELQAAHSSSNMAAEEVFIPLKYGYDNLPNDSIRSCLLHCSSYADGDKDILKSELVDKWNSQGFLKGKDENEGYSYIETLIDASLLEKGWNEENVKMHKVIRDMTLRIAGDGFDVKAAEVSKDAEKLSLIDNK